MHAPISRFHSPLCTSNRSATAALLAFVLSLAGGRALAEDAALAKPEAAAASKPAEAAAPAPAESKPVETIPPAPTPAPVEILLLPPPPPPPPEWKVQSKGGFLMTSGNSQTTNVSFGVNGSRKEGNNKLSLEAGMAYGRSKILTVPQPDGIKTDPVTGAPTITRLERESRTSTNNWATKGRYDRFLSENNTAYASTQWAGDKIAGKTLFGGGQAGYSRQVWKDDLNLVVAELGYDFSYERYVDQPGKVVDPVTIHSARGLLGETLSLTGSTGLTASVETLVNLNKETKAIDASNGKLGVSALKDIRVNAKAGITTNLWKKLSLGLSFSYKYDQNPAPRPVPAGAPAGTAYPSDAKWAFADKVDTLTEATLIYTFF